MRRLFTGLTCLALLSGTAGVVGGSAANAASIAEPPPGGASGHPHHGNPPAANPEPEHGKASGANPEPEHGKAPGPDSGQHGIVDRRARTLMLTIRHGVVAFPADRTVLLRCSPAGGTHPKAAAACRVLRPVHGNPSKLHLSPGAICPKIYNPVTVTARGVWDGHTIGVQRTFGNSCVLLAATGPVYDF